MHAVSQPRELLQEQYAQILSCAKKRGLVRERNAPNSWVVHTIDDQKTTSITLFRKASGKCYYLKHPSTYQGIPTAPDVTLTSENLSDNAAIKEGSKSTNISEAKEVQHQKKSTFVSKFKSTNSSGKKIQEKHRARLETRDLIALNVPEELIINVPTLVCGKGCTGSDVLGGESKRSGRKKKVFSDWRCQDEQVQLDCCSLGLMGDYDNVHPFTLRFSHKTMAKLEELIRVGGDTAGSRFVGKELSDIRYNFHKETQRNFEYFFVIERSKKGHPHLHGVIAHNESTVRQQKKLRQLLRKISKDSSPEFTGKELDFTNFDPERGGIFGWVDYMTQRVPQKSQDDRIGNPVVSTGSTQLGKTFYTQQQALYKSRSEKENIHAR